MSFPKKIREAAKNLAYLQTNANQRNRIKLKWILCTKSCLVNPNLMKVAVTQVNATLHR